LKKLLTLGLVAAILLALPMQASAEKIQKETYDSFLLLRFKEKWLLPPVSLRNDVTAYNLDTLRAIKPFTGGNVGRAINSVDLAFQAAPFGTDVMANQEQARALVQFGMLSHIGHFAVSNANDPDLKAAALDILGQLSEIADHFKMSWLRSQYQRLITDVSAPTFQGGMSSTLDKYDASVASLYDYVSNTYGPDGHWYFMYGGATAGLFALSAGGDQVNTEYFLAVLSNLYHRRPIYAPELVARVTLRNLKSARYNDPYIAANTWNSVRFYLLGDEQYVNPYWTYEWLPEWNSGSEYPLNRGAEYPNIW